MNPGFAGFIQPRSGLASRHGVSIVNTPGLIDSHYRGEIKVILVNLDRNEPFRVNRGDKICQLAVSYTHLRAHETRHDLVCRLLLENKKQKKNKEIHRLHKTNSKKKTKTPN